MSSPSTGKSKLDRCGCGVFFTKRTLWTKENPEDGLRLEIFFILKAIGRDATSSIGSMNLKWLNGKEKS